MSRGLGELLLHQALEALGRFRRNRVPVLEHFSNFTPLLGDFPVQKHDYPPKIPKNPNYLTLQNRK